MDLVSSLLSALLFAAFVPGVLIRFPKTGSFKTVLFVPVQTVALPATLPPTDAGETVIVPVAFTEPQPPINGIE